MKIFRRKKTLSRNNRAGKYARYFRIRSEVYRGLPSRLGLLAIFVVGATLLFPPMHRSKEAVFKEGDIADREIIAPFDFDVAYSEEELVVLRSKATLEVLPVFSRDSTVEQSWKKSLHTLFDSLRVISTIDSLQKEQKIDMAAVLLPNVTKNVLRNVVDPATLSKLSEASLGYQEKLFERGIINNSGPLRGGDFTEIAVVDQTAERRLPVRNIVDQGGLDQLIREEGYRRLGRRDKVQVFFEVVRSHLSPNLIWDTRETQKRRDLAIEAVPKAYTVSKSERIVGKHDKVSKEQEHILKALEDMRATLVRKASPLTLLGLYTAEIIRLLLFAVLLGAYLYVFHRRIYRDLGDLTAILAVLLLFLVFMAVVNRFALSPYLIPVAFVSLMLTALFGYRLGLAATVFACFLVYVVSDVPASVGFVSLIAGTLAVVGLLNMRSRIHFYSVFFYITAAYLVGIFGHELGQTETGEELYNQGLWALGNSLFSCLSVMFLLPIFEGVFNVTTRFTLLELTDLNKPILKRLNMEAPGTYHHSMLLGSLVDSVASDVGADALKARVMAYHHDIGKIFKPEYYAENQEAGFNKHEKITPQMSALILLSHVKDGVELAREEKLPEIVIDGIREHHGTTVMAFFYQKALETDSHSSVNKDDFRYPGPRPRSKEAAILMLADTVEPACRSLKDPTPAHVRNMVVKLVDGRAQEGELDDSHLTLSDLARIKDKFVSILTGIYHKRVAYPGQDKEEETQGEAVAKSV